MQLRPNLVNEFPVAIEGEIMPLLRKQRGFLDELLLAPPENREAVAISLGGDQGARGTPHRERYPRIEVILEKFLEGFPNIKKYDAEYSTFHKSALAAKA